MEGKGEWNPGIQEKPWGGSLEQESCAGGLAVRMQPQWVRLESWAGPWTPGAVETSLPSAERLGLCGRGMTRLVVSDLQCFPKGSGHVGQANSVCVGHTSYCRTFSTPGLNACVLSSRDNKQWLHTFPSALGGGTVPSFRDDCQQCLVQVQVKRGKARRLFRKTEERRND